MLAAIAAHPSFEYCFLTGQALPYLMFWVESNAFLKISRKLQDVGALHILWFGLHYASSPTVNHLPHLGCCFHFFCYLQNTYWHRCCLYQILLRVWGWERELSLQNHTANNYNFCSLKPSATPLLIFLPRIHYLMIVLCLCSCLISFANCLSASSRFLFISVPFMPSILSLLCRIVLPLFLEQAMGRGV